MTKNYRFNQQVLALIEKIDKLHVRLKKIEYGEKVIFSCNLFQKAKLSYILDSLNYNTSNFFVCLFVYD